VERLAISAVDIRQEGTKRPLCWLKGLEGGMNLSREWEGVYLYKRPRLSLFAVSSKLAKGIHDTQDHNVSRWKSYSLYPHADGGKHFVRVRSGLGDTKV